MKTIFLVDDSATMLMSLEGVLTKAGHKVEKASSGEDALDKLKKGSKPDLIITDYHMPGMNGTELIKAIRAIPALKFKPILMLTTEAEQKKRMDAKAAGASGWLVKPLKPEELLGVVKQVLPGA